MGKPHRGEAISFIISTLVRNCGDNSGRQFLTERHNKSRKFLVLLFAKIVISIVVITANIFQGCAITHHNLANSRCRYWWKGRDCLEQFWSINQSWHSSWNVNYTSFLWSSTFRNCWLESSSKKILENFGQSTKVDTPCEIIEPSNKP